MDDEVRDQRCAFQRPRLPRNVVEGHLSRDLVEVDRKERRREGSCNALSETHERGRRSPDVQSHPLVPEWREAAQPLEVIEVQMGEEEVDTPRAALQKVQTELPDPGPGVQHKDMPLVE